MRTTRSTDKKRKIDEGIVEEVKPKIMTLGKHLALERQAEEEKLLESDEISKYVPFENYAKGGVISDLSATEVNANIFQEHNYYTSAISKDAKILLLTLKTNKFPKKSSHFCNNTSLKWYLANLHIDSSKFHFSIP